MLLVISPAKSLDFKTTNINLFSQPSLIDETELLVKVLKKYTAEDLSKIMKISDKLAQLNYNRFQAFSLPFSLENAKQAILAFQGDVYKSLQIDDFLEEDLQFAQKHLRILSGLYGVLRPLDLMQAYRLEMGTPLPNIRGKNLYAFWGTQLSEQLNNSLEKSAAVIVNLASKEYWSAVETTKLEGKVYTIHFKEKRDKQYKVISFNAKKARGLMCRYVIKNRISAVEELKKFNLDNYQFNAAMSSENEWTFTR